MPVDPMKIDIAGCEPVAFASSHSGGFKERWTELRVWHIPANAPRVWVAEARGCSAVPGERDRATRLAAASLDRALKLFDGYGSDLAVAAKETAHEFAEEHGLSTRPALPRAKTDEDAIRILMGVRHDLPIPIREAGRAIGMGESTLRAALKNDTDVRVGLRAILPFVDVVAFQRSLETARG